jgi:hypothetical protein
MFTKCKTIKYITCLLDEFIPEKEQRFKLQTKRDSTNDKKVLGEGHRVGRVLSVSPIVGIGTTPPL